MSRLSELRATRKATRNTEKIHIPKKPNLQNLQKGTFEGSVGTNTQGYEFFSPPEPADRLCYQCQHFQRSPYGFPLGLCQQHGDKNEHPSGRIRHSTSRPTQLGCGDFVLRPPADDTQTCLACRHYSQQSAMCDAVNTGCPYPDIPPCSGERFQQGGNRL